jgi:hypothetical protein
MAGITRRDKLILYTLSHLVPYSLCTTLGDEFSMQQGSRVRRCTILV